MPSIPFHPSLLPCRSHEGNRPTDNIQVYSDNDTLSHLALFARVFASLAPYKKRLMVEAKEKGWPLTRPLFFHYPYLDDAWGITDQFMLGGLVVVRRSSNKWRETDRPLPVKQIID